MKVTIEQIDQKQFDELVKWSGLFVENDREGYFYFETGVRIDIGKTRTAAAEYLREMMKPIK